MTRVIKKPQALRDLINHAKRIADDNPSAARKFLLSAEETFATLASNPRVGRVRRLRNHLLADLRQWPVKGFRIYLIFYQFSGHEVAIVRVLHGAQDVDSILELEP